MYFRVKLGLIVYPHYGDDLGNFNASFTYYTQGEEESLHIYLGNA